MTDGALVVIVTEPDGPSWAPIEVPNEQEAQSVIRAAQRIGLKAAWYRVASGGRR